METFDYETQFVQVKKDVAQALTKALDVQAPRTGLRLQAKDVQVDDNASSSDWEGQREAVRKDKTWGIPVYATIELSDRKTGKVISTAKRVKVATLPKPTDFGSFIVDGKHYQVQNQLRRKPGIYVTEKENGEAKTEINIAGRPFDVEFDQKKEIFSLVLKHGDSSKKTAPLYPVLSRLGISDSMLAKAWGQDILDKNKAIPAKASVSAVKKVAQFFHTGETFDSPDDATKAITSYLDEQTEVRPEVTEKTIGKAFTKVTPEAIVLGSKELLRTVGGERGTDDRHALEYKKALGLSDVMRDRFLKPNGELSDHMNDMRRKLGRKLDNQRNPPTQVSQLVNASQFTPAITSFFTKTELSSTTDQTNPINMLNGMSKITIMGEGGAGDPQRVRPEEHTLHPSQLGFIDPVHTPDSEKIGLVMNLPIGVSKQGDDLQTAVYDFKTKKNRRISPSDAVGLVVGFPDQFKDNKPIGKTVKAMVHGEIQLVDPDKVDVVLKSSRQAFSIASNTIPFAPSVAGVRAQMATKMLEQAIPLLHREAPLVQVKLGGKTIEDAIGSGFSVRALEDGTVKSVSKNRIVIGTKDGEVEHPIYSNLPLNNKSFVDATPTVKVGDKVQKDDVIADSNFTKNGTLAIGTNLRAAYLPWKGYNFEDGIVLTESAAKKLTSEHMHQHVHEPMAGSELGLDKFLAWNQGGLDNDKQGKLDADGVVKKGSILKKGDPLWVGAQERRMDDPDALALRRLGGAPGKKAFMEEWTEDHPGEVIDVVRVGKKLKIFVKTKEPAQIGDKLCYTPDHDVLTNRGWVPIADVAYADLIATITSAGRLEYQKPTWICRYDDVNEDLYLLETQQISLFVTSNHSLYVRGRDATRHVLVPASECFGKRVRHKKNAHWIGRAVPSIELPGHVVGCGQGGVGRKVVSPVSFETNDFLRLVGFFIAEGWRDLPRTPNRARTIGGGGYRVCLSQTKPAGRRFIESVCGRLGLHLTTKREKGIDVGYIINHRHLWEWVAQCGSGAFNKKIPEWILELSTEHLMALWEGLRNGDGSVYNESGSEAYFTSSRVLADQIQELALKIGWAANLRLNSPPPADLTILGKRVKKAGQSYSLRIVKSKCEPQVNHGHVHEQNAQREEYVPYRGSVFCVEVPSHVIYVRRNGKPVWCGNTNRHAAKGIVTKIIPDGQAPRSVDGKPVDIILNPHGIVGRINPSQILETAASKLALIDEDGHVTKPYVVDNESGENYAQTVTDQIAKAGHSDTEMLYDPHSNEQLGNVLTGPQYFLKLSKQATSQFSARSPIASKNYTPKYDSHGNPLEGGEGGSKALDMLSFYSMLSHGSRANLQEMSTFKATKNQPFWDWLAAGSRSGMIKPPPEPTFAYKKFEAYLKAAGVNVKRNGSKMVIQPMTDKEVDHLSNGALKEPIFVRGKDLEEEKGGLMDPIVFGGRKGANWGHIDLAEPIPNPAFETPIKTLTGLKNAQYQGLVQGKLWLNPDTGEMGGPELGNHPDTVTGGLAIKSLLSKINIDQDLADWTAKAKTATTPAKLDEANKRLKYLAALKKLKVRPEDVYVQSKIPVLPPQFRPVIEMDDGTLSNAGLNTLYRDVALVNQELKWHNDQPFIPDSLVSDGGPSALRQNLYNGVKAIAGLDDPIAYYPGSRRPKGVIEQIQGPPAKRGFYQYNVLRRRQEPVGRGTIIPEPKLGVDEVGLPEEMAWKIFEPFIMRRLVNQSGMSPTEASKEVEDRSPTARSGLEAEMSDRPVILNRAPSLHKFSLMAFKPQLTDGRAIKIPPLVVKGFGADFDGDTMTVHVPILPDAVREAHAMLPSNNLYNPGTGKVMIQPQNEAALGLFQMSSDPEKRKEIVASLPAELQDKYKDKVLNKHGLGDLMQDLAAIAPNDYGKVVDRLKAMGDDHTYRTGFTVGLKDLLPNVPEKDQIFHQVEKDIAKLDTHTPKGHAAAIKLISEANEALTPAKGGGPLERRMTEQGNSLNLMVRSGARGNMNQLKQIVSAPFMVDDHRGNPQAVPVLRSFAEGLPLSDYWATLYGARAAATDKQLQTSEPGAFNKDIMATAITNVIAHDPGGENDEHDGIDLPLKTTRESDLTDRFLASTIKVGGTVLAHAGDPVTSSLLNTLRDRKVATVKVRSPLTSRAAKGIYAKDYGLTENGQLPTIGTNVGAIAGQSLSEPLTQMTLRTFHSGGVSGTRGAISGYEKIDKLFKMHQIKQGKATLARHDGKVTNVEDLAGGKNVYIGDDDTPHFIEKNLWKDGGIKVGSRVEKGDILSDGIVQPQELVKLKGMLAAQNYIVDQIHGAYHEQGVPIKRKIVETVVRSVGNTTKILDPADSSYLPGDVAPWTEVEAYNNSKHGDVAVDDSLGHRLLEDIPGTQKGAAITDRVKSLLKHMGKQKVTVGPKEISHQPFLAGIERVPILRKDWMAQMGYQNLKDAIIGGAAEAQESDIHGFSPVPAFAYGAEFGEAPGGKSKKEGVY